MPLTTERHGDLSLGWALWFPLACPSNVVLYSPLGGPAADRVSNVNSEWPTLDYSPLAVAAISKRLFNAVYLCPVSTRLIAMPSAFFVPTRTTSCLPLVTEWFVHETERVYAILLADDEGNELVEVATWMEKQGGEATPRQLARTGLRAYRDDTTGATDVLDRLVGAAWAERSTRAKHTGRPKTVYRLVADKSAKTPGNFEFCQPGLSETVSQKTPVADKSAQNARNTDFCQPGSSDGDSESDREIEVRI